MTEKDFSTIKKTLCIIQKIQVTKKLRTMWVHKQYYEDGTISVIVTIFKNEIDDCVSFYFFNFSKPKERLKKYNDMMDYINEK